MTQANHQSSRPQDMPLTSAWLRPVNAFVRRALPHASLSDNAWEGLAGHNVRVILRGFPQLIATLGEGEITLSMDHEPAEAVSLTLVTDIASLKSLIEEGYAPPGKLQMSGDMGVAQQLQNLLKKADIDWTGLLATFIGETPAHLTREGAYHTLHYAQQVARDKATSLTEYWLHEKQWLVHEAQWETLRTDSQNLIHQIERNKAKVQKLQQRLSTLMQTWEQPAPTKPDDSTTATKHPASAQRPNPNTHSD